MTDVAEWQYDTPEDHTCSACGATNTFPAQDPAVLATPQGVKWECNACGAANQLGGHTTKPLDEIVECGECHSTYDNREGSAQVEFADDGTWTCPNCSTPNRFVGPIAEGASGAQAGAVS